MGLRPEAQRGPLKPAPRAPSGLQAGVKDVGSRRPTTGFPRMRRRFQGGGRWSFPFGHGRGCNILVTSST